MRAMQRSLAIRLLLIFALLFAQLGGLTHGIAHTLAEQQQSDQSLPHDKLCDLCASYAQLGGALSSHSFHFTAIKQTGDHISTVFERFSSTRFTAFSARAPPYSA